MDSLVQDKSGTKFPLRPWTWLLYPLYDLTTLPVWRLIVVETTHGTKARTTSVLERRTHVRRRQLSPSGMIQIFQLCVL